MYGCVGCILHKGIRPREQVGLKSSLASLASRHVLVKSCTALKQECLFLICTKMLSSRQAILPQRCIGPEALPFSNLPKDSCGLAAACLVWEDSSYYSHWQEKTPSTPSQWGRAVECASEELTPASVAKGSPTVNFKLNPKLYHRVLGEWMNVQTRNLGF